MMRWVMAAALLAVAGPAAATGYQTVFDFDDQAVDATSLALGSNPVNNGTGGTIVVSPAAHSGTHVYQGTTLKFVVDDEIDYDWPAVGGWITGPDAVTLTGWHYNADTHDEDRVGVVTLAAGSVDTFLALGSDRDIVRVTKWQFASDRAFTLDDLTVGLVNVPGGIPEPAAWGLMVGGFGVVGMSLRGRRRWSRAAA